MKLKITNYRSNPKLRGAGDVVHAVAQATGAAHLTKTITEMLGVECRCAERREWLNEKLPFHGPPPGPL